MIAEFHHKDFNLRELGRLKRAQGVTISCVVPTLNEAATVARVVSALRRNPLVDECVVVDSGSADETCARAAEAGASVFLASAIRPELGPARGKGENLWKALFVTRGDLVMYADGDLRNAHPRLVTGLVGPLLTRPDLSYVKAHYERAGGGGRVTEILVRPMLRRFFPELAGLHQPLAGEYAARRSVLERLPFPHGYSVETTHLIDFAREFGVAELAQTDLGRRVHRMRPLADLGRMSEEILQSLLARLPADVLATAITPSSRPFERPPAGHVLSAGHRAEES
ncbi:MAG: glucosyl-3-phosphoglycerate synthase [Verrucomicrobiales bacterium]